MGKHSKNIKKHQQVRKDGQLKQMIKQYVQQSKKYINMEEYAKVIDNLAEMIEKKLYDAEAMYDGAYSYYMLGDYKRATAWVENVLSYAPNHIQARLLLAKLCVLEVRWQDVFALYELLVQAYGHKLTVEEQEEIKESMEEVRPQLWQENQEKYPHLAKFLHVEPEHEAVGAAVTSKEMSVSSDSETVHDVLGLVRAKKEEVLHAQVSAQKKLKMLNIFAAGFFLEKEYGAAELLLGEALKIDDTSNETLRNMVVLQSCMGNEAKKEAFLALMPLPDFQLLSFKP